jgi:hypothetical protein
MASLTWFIEHRLERRSFLGVTVRNDPVSRPCIADKA